MHPQRISFSFFHLNKFPKKMKSENTLAILRSGQIIFTSNSSWLFFRFPNGFFIDKIKTSLKKLLGFYKKPTTQKNTLGFKLYVTIFLDGSNNVPTILDFC